MFNPKIIDMIRYSLQTANMNKIELCAANIKMYFYYLIPHIGLKKFQYTKI